MTLEEMKEKMDAVRELSDDELANTNGGFGFGFNNTMTAIIVTLAANENASSQIQAAFATYGAILKISGGMELVTAAAAKLDDPKNIGMERTCTIGFAFQPDQSLVITGVTTSVD